MKNIWEKFTDSARNFMRAEIKESGGNEVYFGVNLNEHGMLEYTEVIARGNENSVPAIINVSLEYDAVAHNHPSGNLTPSSNDINIASELGNNAGVGFIIVNSDVSEYYEVIKPIRADKIEPIDIPSALYMFTEDGKLGEILPNYEYRHEQALLTESMLHAFNDNTCLMAEAGTGIGKSLSYLVPALLWLKQNKTRIVVSTNTINLQEQIIKKDLPMIASQIAPEVRYTLVKGRGNYVCVNKVKEALLEEKEGSFGFDNERLSFLEEIDMWLEKTSEGSISDLGYKPRSDFWEIVRSDNDTCLHRKCEHIEKCFYYKMKKVLNASQLLIVNHHILCADISLLSQTGGAYALLPRYTKIIVDEAHNFEDSASSYFGDEGSRGGIIKALYYISNPKKHSGIAERIRKVIALYKDTIKPEDFDKAMGVCDKVIESIIHLRNITDEGSKAFYQFCQNNIDRRDGSSYRFRINKTLVESERYKDSAMPPIREIISALLSAVNNMSSLYKLFIDLAMEYGFDYEDVATLALAYSERLKKQLSSLNAVFNYKDDEYIRWVETRITKKGTLILSWNLTPVSVSKYLYDSLYSKFETSILVSATLTVNKKFDFFSDRLGFSLINEKKRVETYLSSPFNFEENARLYVATDAPDVSSSEFNSYTSEYIINIMEITGGRAFALFTSFSSLMKVYEEIEHRLKQKNINVLTQTAGMHRNTLLEMFKSSENNILLGVDSFWEGVDVVGKNLEVVIIPKLPFAVPTDPISEGRYEYIEASGGNAFIDYALPFAIIKFKQGFGRLIRSKTDRGVVLVLDRRVVSKRYGVNFINSLPSVAVVKGSMDDVLDGMADFF